MPVTTETTKLHVSGMTCSGCVNRVTRVLERLDGVREAKVTLHDETARIDYDPAKVGVKTFTEAIEKAGYGAEEK